VGEGDAILVQQGNTQVLVDGGPSPQAVTLALSKQMPFWDRTIELLILTHPHSDHLAGLVEVLKRYKVKEVIYPSIDDSSPVFQEWLTLIKDKEIKSLTACAGQQITIGEHISIEVLNPQTKLLAGTESDIDNNCVALSVQEGKISFLLTGDMMLETEMELTRHRADLACTVLKAAHHGSDTSSTQAFLAVADPQIAVISCGAGNNFGHPNEAALERLEERVGESNVYRTDIDGTVNFTTDGERLWVKTER
jgi:competence protein ComEC